MAIVSSSRDEIKREINAVKNEIRSLQAERAKYQNSLQYANKLISQLKSSSTSLVSSEDYLKKYFTIDGNTVDGGEILNSKNKVNDMIKSMNQNVIPEIQANIRNIEAKLRNNENMLKRLEQESRAAISKK